jgi:hypothetical protein
VVVVEAEGFKDEVGGASENRLYRKIGSIFVFEFDFD